MDMIGQPPSGRPEGSGPVLPPELLMPAGGFDAAIAAFDGGADAVYLGFRDFSARKQARNFDREEYRRLLGHARKNGKRIYVTLNTVMTEAELPKVSELLVFLSRFSPDAILFQDWGLASLVHEEFPSLVLHASTQTAIQTAEAARLAASFGVSRIVLPRECGLAELERFRAGAPGLEYEVFVHGALCYSFSGLCLASGLLLGRSGNRGECAQVCRSYYRREDGNKGYWFSCKDLCLVEDLAALARAGAVSFKVEGRMKSPEYVHAVARLYRAAIDRACGKEGVGEEELSRLLDAARTAFSRSPTKAYLRTGKGEDLIDSVYPGHRGSPLGTVVSAGRGKAVVQLGARLGLRDGIMAFGSPKRSAGGPPGEPIAFAAIGMSDARSGRPLVTARPGSLVELEVPEGLAQGDELRLVSSREADRRKVAVEEYEAAVEPVPARLCATGTTEELRLSLEVLGPALGLLGAGESRLFVDGEAAPLEPARSPGGFAKALALFAESGAADFRFDASLCDADVPLPGGTAKLADLFLPPSFLKKSKNRLYAAAAAWAEEATGKRAGELALPRGPAEPLSSFGPPPRRLISFPSEFLASGLPFLTAGLLEDDAVLPVIEGRSWLPLSPLVSDWPSYEASVERLVAACLAEGREIVVGIDAFHHLPLALKLRGLDPDGSLLSFYGDVHLYCANSRALAFWQDTVPGLAFAYAWIEDGEGRALHAVPGLAEAGADFEPPLFMSRGCYARHDIFGGSCPPDCPRRYSYRLSDRERRYRVVVDGCVTMLYREAALQQRPELG
jgi:putative protease